MLKKEKEQILARHLRKRGLSLKEISSRLNVAQSSVSAWVRDVRLTKNQIIFLKHKPHLQNIIKKRVETRIANENIKRQSIIHLYKKEILKNNLTLKTLKIIGATLYWAEGGKSQKNRIFNFTNSDPLMIQTMMTFLRIICNIPEVKFRGHIHIHYHLNRHRAEKYWEQISGIPKKHFYKTTQVINKSSKNTRDTLPHGTFSIQIGSVDLFLKMLAWTEAIHEKVRKTFI